MLKEEEEVEEGHWPSAAEKNSAKSPSASGSQEKQADGGGITVFIGWC
jgi:hypothetical protein